MMGIARLFCLVFVLVSIIGCQQAPHHTSIGPGDSELQQLTAALNAAKTQTDMNVASKKISEFWDAKLASVESRIDQKLDDEQQRKFAECKEQWLGYRAQQVEFQSGLFMEGSIGPLIANEKYSEITKHRVEELESLWVSTLQARR